MVVTSQKVTVYEMMARFCEKRNSKLAEKAAVLDPPPSMECAAAPRACFSARLQALLGVIALQSCWSAAYECD